MDSGTRHGSGQVTLIAYEPSFRRVEAALAPWLHLIKPVLVGTDGTARISKEDLPAGKLIAWASPEVFIDGRLSQFVRHVLSIDGLRWFQSGSAGYDNTLLRSVIARGPLFTVNTAPSTCIAEYVFATVLDHFQHGTQRRADRAVRLWRPFGYREIAGTQWLLLGFGAIGSRVARRAQAFEARVIAVNRSGVAGPGADEAHSVDALPSLLPRADVVVLAMPLTPTTANLANDQFFAGMKHGATFVNVSRGGLVDEDALLRALDLGSPGHAILDVFAAEPLPADSPLWTHPRISMSAHLAGMGSGLVERSDRIFVENLRRFLLDEPLQGLVGG